MSGSPRLASQFDTILGALEIIAFDAPADAAYSSFRGRSLAFRRLQALRTQCRETVLAVRSRRSPGPARRLSTAASCEVSRNNR